VSLKGNCRRLRNRRRDLIGKRLQKPAYGGRQSTIIQRWAFSVSFNGGFWDTAEHKSSFTFLQE
jgi:hypothetical protein